MSIAFLVVKDGKMIDSLNNSFIYSKSLYFWLKQCLIAGCEALSKLGGFDILDMESRLLNIHIYYILQIIFMYISICCYWFIFILCINISCYWNYWTIRVI